MGRGLLGLLVALVVIGGAAALAVTSLSGPGGVPLVTTTVAGVHGPSSSSAGGSPDGAALAQSCTADAEGVESAVQAYLAQNGRPPPSIAALVPTWLRAAPSSAHYTIALDASGRVGVLPPGASSAGPVPAAADYDLHPTLCDSVPR